ncbi:hypothetical protein C8Q74DRAFT_1371295 [Fomes fomentarius]|nr:hypothetical protein C8Q74DRAFT_1371295 [Fomes fomentarius]
MTDVREPALPWDTLREIAFICPQRTGTCATLMRTCTFFYHEAAASILAQEIRLYGEPRTVGFLKFLHAGKKPRYPCVRRLDLRYNYSRALSPDSAKALADAIALMTGLVGLRIRSGEYTMRHWPAVGDAVSSLPSLRHIVIEDGGPGAWQILLSLHSTKLKSVKLDIYDGRSERTSWLSSHPVQLFGRWTSTLTKLEYSSPRLPAPQYTPPIHQEVYPMMRTLLICHDGHMDPVPYIRAFPNLAHLRVQCTSHIYGSVYKARTSNIRSQRELQLLGPAPQHPGWQKLIQFNGTFSNLYALALNCHISHIQLAQYMDDTNLPLLSTVLADAQPLHLNINWFTGGLDHSTNILPPILLTQGASRLESLVISCKIDRCTAHEDVASALLTLNVFDFSLPLLRLLRCFQVHSVAFGSAYTVWQILIKRLCSGRHPAANWCQARHQSTD